MRHTLSLGLALLSCAWGVVSCEAQAPASQPPLTPFQKLFPNPSGNNGYEELVMAGDLLRDNSALDAATAERATLTAKRHALADPAVRKALELLNQGLEKPLVPPHSSINADTTFPELGSIRSLARVLQVQQYVFLADGHVSEAIASMRTGLRLSFAAKGDKLLISGLVGVASDRISINAIARHIDQLSVRDCDIVQGMVAEWLAAPDAFVASLAQERDLSIQAVNKLKVDAASAFKEFLGNTNDPDPATLELQSILANNPQVIDMGVDQAVALINARCDNAIANLQMPASDRKEWKDPMGNPIATRIMEVVCPDYNVVVEKLILDKALLQMLGIHAAIR